MSSIKAFPQNIDISPDNWQNLKLVRDFMDRKSGVEVVIENFTLVREGYNAMLDWLDTEGLAESPAATYTDQNGQLYDMFIDVQSIDVGLDDIKCDIKMRKSNDHFFDRMRFLSWQIVRNEGYITDDMIVDFPFVVVPDNLRAQKAIQIATLLSISFQIAITIKEIADAAGLLANPLNVGVFLAQVAAFIVYAATMSITLAQTLINLQELFFPFVRYHKAISDLNLMRAACAREGYTFISDFMENERNMIHTISKPEAISTSTFDNLDNFFQSKYLNGGFPASDDTGGQNPAALFEEYLQQYDVDMFVYDNVVRLERSSYFANNSTVNVKPTYSDQENNDDRYSFNWDELWGRKFVRWSNDENDGHSKT